MTSSGYMTDKYPPHTPAPSLSSDMANTLCLAAVLLAVSVPSLHATFGGHGKVVDLWRFSQFPFNLKARVA